VHSIDSQLVRPSAASALQRGAAALTRHYDVVIVGGGQAGLAMGYHLARHGRDFVILDAAQRTGEAWRKRWDSLTLFTPARYSALPGLRFPAEPEHLPRKDEVADYLERYAERFTLPIRHGERVTRLEHVSEWRGFHIETEQQRYEADQVVIATGPFQRPFIPAIAGSLSEHVVQLHSSSYRSPAQLPDGDVIVVGGGNSGVQIAAELASTRRTWLSIGDKVATLPDRFMGRNVFWWLETLGAMNINVQSRLGQRASRRDFLIGKSAQASALLHGIRLTGRVSAASDNVLFTSSGDTIEVAAVVWATGFRSDYRWIRPPVLSDNGQPIHTRGVSPVNGLSFLGLPWQHTRGSALLGWVGRDAEFLARHIMN
jgi:putative flavoprotein involved in K+ transport